MAQLADEGAQSGQTKLIVRLFFKSTVPEISACTPLLPNSSAVYFWPIAAYTRAGPPNNPLPSVISTWSVITGK